MRKTTVQVILAAAAWLASTGCGPSEPGEGVHTAGFVPGARPGAAVAQADTPSIVTRRIWAGIADLPMGSPSPDGKSLTFVDWNTGDLAIRDLQTSQERHITDEGYEVGFAEYSRISPDGRLVAYTWYESDSTTSMRWRPVIRVIPVEGGESRVLLRKEGNYYAQPFDWSADGTQVLVGLARSDGTNQIVLVDVADAEPHDVTLLSRGEPTGMALSPDGRYVAYDVPREAGSPEHTVHIVSADGSGDREVTGPGGHNVVIGWEPSGRYLLYYGDHSGSPSVWALETAEGRPQGDPVLVRSDLWHLTPVGFNAAGDLFYSVNTGKVDVFTVLTDAETRAPIGRPESVTPLYQAGKALYPRWSPDGRYLAYRRTPPSGGGMRHGLVIRAVETGEFREINLDLAVLLTPNWSTDGRFIVLYGKDRDREGIYRIDVQTGAHGVVHTIAGDLRGVAWIDDGRTLVYKEVQGGAGPDSCRFVTRELASGREREVYRWPCQSKDWWWTLSPDRRTIAGFFGPVENPVQNPWPLRLVSLADGASRELAGVKAGLGAQPEVYWTPDSRTVYTWGCSSPEELNQALNRCPRWSFDVATGERRRLPDDAPIGSIHPDGRRVAFTDGKTAYEVWVMEGYLPIRGAGSARER